MTNSDIIQSYYNIILNRSGSPAEVAAWASLVDSGVVPLSQVQSGLINSFEALNNVAPIIEMYQADLGHVPSQVALRYWVTQLDTGVLTQAQIGLAIASSPESQTFYGVGYDGNFVTQLYSNILGRLPDGDAVNAWLALKLGGMTQAMMKETFRNSPEAKERAAPAVTSFLTSAVQANPSAYTGSLYSAGSIFTLTTAPDTGTAFTGGAGNDTFNATETPSDPPVPTWTTSDAIDGGLGTNTLNVTQTAGISGAPLNATVTNIQIANIADTGRVTLDTTGWSGLTALNVTDGGDTGLTAAGTTAVTVNDSAGTVTVAGGSAQTVSTSAGDVTLSGATGAIAVTDSAVGAHDISVDGGSSVAVTTSGETANGRISIGGTTAPTGAVTVIASSSPIVAGSMGTIAVVGGSTVDVTENVLGPVSATSTAGFVQILGTAVTTSVSVSQTAHATSDFNVAGVDNNSVAISDVNAELSTLAGTITSVTARNYTGLGITDTALTTLNLAGGSGNIIIDNSGLDTPTNKTLAVTVDGLTGGTLDDADIYTRGNFTTTGTNSTLANITTGALTALTVTGTKVLRLNSAAGLTALRTVTVSGSAGVTADFSTPGTVTSIDTSATTGTSVIILNGGTTTFTGGAGADNVTLTQAAVTHAIAGGLGSDTLSMDATAARTASGSSTFAGLVTGFEKLVLTGATNQVVDLAILGMVNAVQTHGGNGLTLDNLSSGGTLTLDGAGTAYTLDNAPPTPGATETLNLVLSADASGGGTNFASTGITAANMQTIAITSVDTEATPAGEQDHRVTLLGNRATTITVSGNNGLDLTAADTAATTVDASSITLGGFSWISGALAGAATVKGSATGSNSVDFSTATHGAVTYTGGSGNDTVTANNAENNVISLGDGANTVTANNGNNTITSGAGADHITVGGGNNTITTGEGADTVTTGNGINTITTGTGAETLSLGAGTNAVTLGAHSTDTADKVTVSAATTATFVPTATITGLNANGVDTITFAGDGSAGNFTTFTSDQLVTFGNTLHNNVTVGSAPPTLAAAVADVLASAGGDLDQHAIGAFQFRGNTYLAEQSNAAGTAFGAGDTVVELTGTPTLNTASAAGGVLQLHLPI